MIVIRKLEREDWQVLRKLRLRAMKADPYAFGSTYDREIAIDQAGWLKRFERTTWFAALNEGDDPCGLAAGMRSSDDPPHARELVSMWVAKEVRGRGVGDSLVTAVGEWARDEGATELYLWVAVGNTRAEDFYARYGFEPTGIRAPFRDDAEMTQLRMRLNQ